MSSKELAQVRRELADHAQKISGTAALARHASDEMRTTYVKHAGDAMQMVDAHSRLAAKAGTSPAEQGALLQTLAAQKSLRDGLQADISQTLSAFNQRETPASQSTKETRRSFVNDVMNGLTLNTWGKKK